MPIGKMLGESFTEDDARYVYEHRSYVAHGRDPWAARLDPEIDRNRLCYPNHSRWFACISKQSGEYPVDH